MKSLGMLRISIIALGSVAAMSIAPRCSAQSEIAPDHFDGTDSWQTVAVAKVRAPKTNPAKAGAAGLVLNGNTSGHATLRGTAVRSVPNAQGQEAVARLDKRKASARKRPR
jgi:hypothetical protein